MFRFDENKPLYLQLRAEIEKAIIEGSLKEHEMIPSIRSLAQEYNLNPQTVANALSELVDGGLIYKQRGIGFFVHVQAREALLSRWQEQFRLNELPETLDRGKRLGVTRNEVIAAVETVYETQGE
jgi:GntR family transcriptional regulator